MREVDLLSAVTRHLRAWGYQTYTEVPLMSRLIDVYGVRRADRKTVAVELKVKNWRQALRQARNYLLAADQVYVAVPNAHVAPPLRRRELFREMGIGLLAIDGQETHVLIRPRASRYSRDGFKRKLISLVSDPTEVVLDD